MVAVAGVRLRWSSGPAVTLIEAVADLPLSMALTVWRPGFVAVQAPAEHVPSGPMVKDDVLVWSPMALPYWS